MSKSKTQSVEAPSKLKVRTPYNSASYKKNYEKNFSPSKTIPNRTMSVKEILDRYAKGLPVAGTKRIPLYTGEEMMPDLEKMDISEIHELRNKVQTAIKEAQDKITAAEQDKLRKMQLEQLKVQLRAEMEEKQKATAPAPSAGGDSA